MFVYLLTPCDFSVFENNIVLKKVFGDVDKILWAENKEFLEAEIEVSVHVHSLIIRAQCPKLQHS